MKKFESKQAITDYILEKTAPVFNRQGYIGSSLSDLTKATNLTKGAIYGNFVNKEELALTNRLYKSPLYAIRRYLNDEKPLETDPEDLTGAYNAP